MDIVIADLVKVNEHNCFPLELAETTDSIKTKLKESERVNIGSIFARVPETG